jgi:3D (Asp-Asp-Asp) domain-containing protein
MGALRAATFLMLSFLALTGCARERREPLPAAPPDPERSLRVTASAYNSLPGQTDDRPGNAAWGDSLFPGLRAIAISRDLIPMGLGQGVTVRIEGLRGEFKVLDKMDARWRKRIDIYFGKDVAAAKAWGERKVVIRWRDSPALDPLTGRSLAVGDSLAHESPVPGDTVTPRRRF